VDEEVMLDHLGAFTELTNVIPTPFLLCSALEQIGYSFPKDDVCVVEVRKNPECIPLPETADGEQLIMLRLISLRTAEVSDALSNSAGSCKSVRTMKSWRRGSNFC